MSSLPEGASVIVTAEQIKKLAKPKPLPVLLLAGLVAAGAWLGASASSGDRSAPACQEVTR